jgi:hypothetical protein
MIQGILFSHYLCSVNLNNHGLPHVLKVLHLSVLSFANEVIGWSWRLAITIHDEGDGLTLCDRFSQG